jgi:hypothetical protein
LKCLRKPNCIISGTPVTYAGLSSWINYFFVSLPHTGSLLHLFSSFIPSFRGLFSWTDNFFEGKLSLPLYRVATPSVIQLHPIFQGCVVLGRILVHGGLPSPPVPGRYSACSPACLGSLLRLFVALSPGHLATGQLTPHRKKRAAKKLPRLVKTTWYQPPSTVDTGSRSLLHHGDGVVGCWDRRQATAPPSI